MSSIKPKFTMTELEEEIASFLPAEDEEALTAPELARKFGISGNKVLRLLDRIGKDNYIVVTKRTVNRIGVLQPRPAYKLRR